VERDHSSADNGVDDEARAQCVKLLDEHKIDAMVQFRRTILATQSAGLAATSVDASTDAGAAASKVVNAASHELEDCVAEELDAFHAPELDASLETEGLRRNSLVIGGIGDGARAIIDGSSTKSCVADCVAQVRGAGTTLGSLLITPGQLKLLLGNLQINASLTVVFDIPWPPVHIRYINFLNVFKFDLFKGLSFMVPCLHSSHFMSLASFVAAVRKFLSASSALIWTYVR